MGGPAWLTYIFAAIMLTVAGYCAIRLVAARRWRRPTDLDADGAHVVMGVAMAGMLVASLRFAPAGLWEAGFGAGALWFGGQAVRVRRGAAVGPWRCPQPVPHLVECGAMLYMLAAIPVVRSASGGSGMGAMGAMGVSATESRFSLLALALALFMFGWVVSVVDRLRVGPPALAVAAPASAVPGSHGVMTVAAGAPDAAAPDAGAPAYGEAGSSAATHPGCGGDGSARGYIAPRCAAMCKIAMGVTMGYMLVMML
jgi:hypothetical protein